jgi:hypothetical protein
LFKAAFSTAQGDSTGDGVVSKMASKARAMQSRLQHGFRVDDLFPPTIDSPENDAAEEFHRNFSVA